MEERLTGGQALADFASGHEFFGLHRTADGWVFREWAPHAESIWLIGDFNGWQTTPAYRLQREPGTDTWVVSLPVEALRHEQLYALRMQWPGGEGNRLPAYARRVVQDDHTKLFSAQVWHPDVAYRWQHPDVARLDAPLIYESHVGMAQERDGIGTYVEFRENVLPRVVDAGYNAVQLMAVAEHPYYGSFGYQVSSFFAASSRFGTPEELKQLVDEAHRLGLAVIMDIVHSHAAPNEVEGLARFDGTAYQYFHDGPRGRHPAWGSCCFNYGSPGVLHFLLSNCRYWLDEFHVDGFRFDGVTSMLYLDHGLGRALTSYDQYFDGGIDEDAMAYLSLANRVIHDVKPSAITIAEDVSGMPGLAAPEADQGSGFDFRLAMGVTDTWYKLINDTRDDDWNMDLLWHELSNHREDERAISYAECHDQALVGGKTIIFSLADAEMYTNMHVSSQSLQVDRAMALHKLIRLATIITAGDGYLNFMGNEFGHPEWVDFPREGNNWSTFYARRQWSLRDNPELKYFQLGEFDRAMIQLVREGKLLETSHPGTLSRHTDDKLLVVQRGSTIVIFNFHPSQSWVDYPLDVPVGNYRLVMCSDDVRFGGFGRLEADQCYRAGTTASRVGELAAMQVYVPARVALVLQREPTGKE